MKQLYTQLKYSLKKFLVLKYIMVNIKPNATLLYISSHDDIIKLCGLNTELAQKHQNIYGDQEKRMNAFDPIISLASNKEVIEGNYDIWTSSKGKTASRDYGTLDVNKYMKMYVKSRQVYLEDNEQTDLKGNGFDCYAYLMAYEDDVMTKYGNEEYEDLSKLQKAALHYIEIGNEPKSVDYLRYVASYDDLTMLCLLNKKPEVGPEEHIIDFGKTHYETTGFVEIHTGMRPVLDFFDAWKYIASYPMTKDVFWNADEDTLNESSATLAYLTAGASSGLLRSFFNSSVYLANYPDHVKDDIYVNNKISEHKVAKVWLKNFPNETKLDHFDAQGYAESNGLKEQMESFKTFVDKQVQSYEKFVSDQKKIWVKVRNMVSCSGKLPHPLDEKVENKTEVKEIEEVKEVVPFTSRVKKLIPKLPTLPKMSFACLSKPKKTKKKPIEMSQIELTKGKSKKKKAAKNSTCKTCKEGDCSTCKQ